MTAASVVTQLHLQTDLTCVCGSLNHMFTYLLREAADTPEYPKTRQGGGDYWEAERSKVFRLPNCPTLDLMKIKVFLLGPKITHQMSKLVWHEMCGMCIYFCGT